MRNRAWALSVGALVTAVAVGTLYAVTPFQSSSQPGMYALDIPANRGASALWQSLRKLRTRASLIMITAHPDDEDGGMLAYESRALGARVALLTLNRGEGGANIMSPDYWDGLGLVRTQELLAAGRYYGVEQYFTRFCDYGFSKTLAEAEAKWGDQRVLADVVRVVRKTRPLVVTSVFVGGPSDGHGNHQMAGRMAKEVFTAAGDPTRFPEQIRAGLKPWTPLKYYAHVPFLSKPLPGVTETVSIPEGTYNPLLGESYVQLSRLGLGEQKTQNGGPFIPRAGAVPGAYHRFASRVDSPGREQSFFDGIDTSLAGIATLAGVNPPEFLARGLQQMQAAVDKASEKFSAEHPVQCAEPLAEGLKATDALVEQVTRSDLSEEARYNVLHELRVKQVQFNNALVEALGITMRATVHPDQQVNPLFAFFMGDPDTFRMAIPGQRFGVQVSAATEAARALTVKRVSVVSPYAKAVSIGEPHGGPGPSLAPNQNADWQFQIEVHDNTPFTRPYFERPSIEQPYYDILDAADLGRPFAPYPLEAQLVLLYDGASIQTSQVVQTVQHVTGRGVVYQPLAIGPAISVQVNPRRGIVPLTAKSFSVPVTLHSNVKGPAKGTLALHLPPGWTSNPAQINFQTANDGDDQTLSFTVTPAHIEQSAYPITAEARYAGKAYREGYVATGYSGVLPYFLYSPATYSVTGTDVKVAPGLKVGYVMGTGDDVPQALTELNIRVTSLSAADLAGANLSSFDVILLGVRAYAARPELATYNSRLLDYVKNGGVLIVQYNTPEFDHNFGPYPYKMGEEPEEVTDEESKVEILNPGNPLFSWPNKISEQDFRGWIEERGSKFLTTWDSRYEPLLETHDPGQAPQKGGLLYAKYGKGIYIYNAYAFYRELPEGVPGAFRLMANMLSLPRNPAR